LTSGICNWHCKAKKKQKKRKKRGRRIEELCEVNNNNNTNHLSPNARGISKEILLQAEMKMEPLSTAWTQRNYER